MAIIKQQQQQFKQPKKDVGKQKGWSTILKFTEKLPESQLSGLSASGWAIRAIIALQTDWSVQAGLHAFFKISRQISPVCKGEIKI